MSEPRVVRCLLHTYPDECYLIVTEQGDELPMGEHKGVFLLHHPKGVGPLKGWMVERLRDIPRHFYGSAADDCTKIATAISEILGEDHDT